MATDEIAPLGVAPAAPIRRSRGTDACDALDLDGDVEGQLGHPDRAASVAAPLSEDIDEQIRAAVDRLPRSR